MQFDICFTIHLTAGPTMPLLTTFRTTTGRKIKVIEEMGTHYDDFGTLLLQDDNGQRVKSIVQECREHAKAINREILIQWLGGRGRLPVSWETLVEVLRDADLETLADDVESSLQ